MNKNALKTFAINARNSLIGAVKKKAFEYGIDESGYGERNATVIGGRPLSSTEAAQRAKLVAKIDADGFEQVM
ncbi:MAG: type II restriction endonuclease subunit M, partial [Clostridia bacterium]|nr:type II restriction endonuclease subunit M [Clostridia bacterium]